ncbi:MAG: L-aspartate oxidase [Ignavibacteriae bacterium]|nr:MAG: L-aspartate oxidase [Ignavibacteriota bacterium]
MSECIETDVLIIGSGIAGSIAALKLADTGIHVVVATRSMNPEESNTFYAQGGIVFRGNHDSPASLIEDIQHAGAGYCNPQAVELLANEGPKLVKALLLEKLAIPFDREADGSLSLVLEGGHSVARILHAADSTGKLIEQHLIRAVKSHPNITLLTGRTAVDLLTPAHHSLNRLSVYDPISCIGAFVLDQESGQVQRILARATILASGGLGQIFLRTTNPAGARGDGLAIAYRAGARVLNCEFVQFHPTAFYHQNAPFFLISEAVRGAGARLIDSHGSQFMQKYDPEWKDLAPRDVVARGIHQEMLTSGSSNVFLDIASYMPADDIRAHFPSIYSNCSQYGIDMTQEPIPIVPAAHYFCGGVWSDLWGRTTVNHLYAVGEVACTGLHGANRLASTSLLEGLVWGYRAAEHFINSVNEHPQPHAENIPPWQETGTYISDSALISQDMSVIKNIMWNYTGLIRTSERLQRALRELRHLESEIERFYRAVKLSDDIIGLRNAVRAAIIVTISAWENKTSVGCHYRQ